MEPFRKPDTTALVHALKFRLKATPLDANHIAEVVLAMFDEVTEQIEERLSALEERLRQLESR